MSYFSQIIERQNTVVQFQSRQFFRDDYPTGVSENTKETKEYNNGK